MKTNHTVGKVALKSICRIDSNLIPIPYDSSLFLKCAHICIYKYICIKKDILSGKVNPSHPYIFDGINIFYICQTDLWLPRGFQLFCHLTDENIRDVNISMFSEIISLY